MYAETNLPECTASERWQRNTVFAVMKKGRKTAVKLYEEKEYAETHRQMDPDNLSVVERPGISVRCEDGYCSAAEFCEQFKRMKDEKASSNSSLS
jgi:hypothetical protein